MTTSHALELLHSLSLASGALVVAGISFVLAFFSAPLKGPAFRWAAALGAPVLVAYALYWSPVWLGDDPSEYSIWALICIVWWSLSGALASASVHLVVRRFMRFEKRHGG